MKCIIVDDEPIARKGIRSLIARVPELELMEMFNNASSAATYLTLSLIHISEPTRRS